VTGWNTFSGMAFTPCCTSREARSEDLSNLLFKRDKKSTIQDEPLLQVILDVLNNERQKFLAVPTFGITPPRHSIPRNPAEQTLLSDKTA